MAVQGITSLTLDTDARMLVESQRSPGSRPDRVRSGIVGILGIEIVEPDGSGAVDLRRDDDLLGCRRDRDDSLVPAAVEIEGLLSAATM